MQSNFSKVAISIAEAERLAKDYFGIIGQAQKLQGEVDFNFLVTADTGMKYTLKITRPDTDPLSVQFETKIAQHLSDKNLPFDTPVPIKGMNSEITQQFHDENGQLRMLRMQSWVEGVVLAEANPRSDELFLNWGKTCGNMSKALQDFEHPYARRIYKWDPSQTLLGKKYLAYFQTKEQRSIAERLWSAFEKNTLPKIATLRQGVNYNDAHELNLLIDSDANAKIIGIIDFGDALHTATINELAIACAYAGMGMPDPIAAICLLVEGYHSVFPMEEKELEVLFSLITARLLITVSSAAWNKHQEPDNEYLQISEKPAWELLKQLFFIDPEFAHSAFRKACGLDASSKRKLFDIWLTSKPKFSSIVSFENKKVIPLDLSVGSKDLGNNIHFSKNENFEKRIEHLLREKDANIGVGGYGEVRPFYSTDAYQVNGNHGAQWRTVHLGLDIWAKAGTEIYAPIDGTVFSVFNNAIDRDYGNTLILQHKVDVGNDALTFYTLYGHLTDSSFDLFTIGDVVRAGELIAYIGAAPANGNWPPHLHFQCMLDMLGNTNDFPGVAFPNEKDIWLSICPDPNLLFPGLPTNETKFSRTDDIQELRKEKLGKGLSVSYENPLHMVRGFGQYLYDTTGRRYLDTVNNVAHVGHEHPRVVKAATKQFGILNTNTRYLHENITNYAEALLSKFPEELCVVHFVNSGSEANELALRMAKVYSGQKDMLAIEVGYHGNTGACIDVSSYKFDGKGGNGAPTHTHILPLPDTFRGKHRAEDAGTQYAAYAKKYIDELGEKGRGVAGIIGESILSCGGQIVPPANYFKELYKLVRVAGGICIMDEVQVGFGRVGEKYWGFELHDVVPDIVTLGKPIGNGHPLGAVVTTRKVADAFNNGMEYFNTFGGNPVSCAIGLEILNIIVDESLQENALAIGNYMKQELMNLQKDFPIIADVRGHGLFLGFEMIVPGSDEAPAAKQASYLANRMRQRGILMSTDGPDHNVIKIKPPICFTKENVDYLVKNLKLVLQERFMR